MRYVVGAIAAVLMAAFAMPAMADSISKRGAVAAEVPAAAPTWTGFYAGASLGYGFARSEFEKQGFLTTSDGKLNTEDLLATVGVGWDMQVSNMVLGIMADITASDFDDTEWKWFVGARAGVLLTPKTLAYALVGYTETSDGQLAFKNQITTRFEDLAGVTVGGGLEHQFAAGWSAKAEYRYVSYGSERAPNDGNSFFDKDGLADGSKIDSGEHQVRVGIAKRF